MSKVQYYCAASLDGYIAEADDTLDWLTKYEPNGEFQTEEKGPFDSGGYDRFYDEVGALVMGSATYEFVLRESTEWGYSGKPSWVLTSRDLPTFEGEDIRIGPASVPELYDELIAAADGKNVWLVGGGNVASQFADAGLLDELLLTVVPVMLGSGKPLFDRRLPGGAMRLTGVSPYAIGMVELRYELDRGA